MKNKFLLLLIILSIFFITALITGCSTSKLDAERMHSELNTYITEKLEDGTVDTLSQYWMNHYEEGKFLDLTALSNENGTIRCGTKIVLPFSFLKDGSWTGLTIELIYNFCKEYGYGLEITDFIDVNSQVVAVSAGKLDISGSNISITEERKKSVDFSPGYFNNRQLFAVKKDSLNSFHTLDDFSDKRIATIAGGNVPDQLRKYLPDTEISEYHSVADMCIALSQGKVDALCYDEATTALAINQFSDLTLTDISLTDEDTFGIIYAKADAGSSGVITSIKRTLIKDNRWQLFLTGIGNTLLITIASIILGSLIGFIVFILCRNGGKAVNRITRFCIWIIDGLPIVVFLMILYYVVFEFLNFTNIVVSIIAFTLVFASSVFSMLLNAVSAIDEGQFEVSYALGYTEKQTLYKMILPQAMRLFWTPCRGAVKTQIKATAIVGYIAATDLTKAGDMIRSSTYEAFFPLLITALVYFLLGALLSRAVDFIRINTAPSKKKSDVYLKDVERR